MTLEGVPKIITVTVKNGKIKEIDVPGLSGMVNSNAIGRTIDEMIKKNAIEPTMQSGNTEVKALVETVEQALKKDPEPTPAVTVLNDGNNWYGRARGNERYDLTPNGSMEVKLTVVGGNMLPIEHNNFGDDMTLKPNSLGAAANDPNTYHYIRTKVLQDRGNTDFVKKAVLRGSNIEGTPTEKGQAAQIYDDVMNGATDPQDIKKRQKSALGYINAIDNAIARAKNGHINLNSVPAGALRYLNVDPNIFRDKVYYRKESENLRLLELPVTFVTGGNGNVTLPALDAVGVKIKGDGLIYNSFTNKLTHDKPLSDYSVTSNVDLTFSHDDKGFEYTIQIPVTRGANSTKVRADKLIIGKGGQNYTLPIRMRADGPFGNYLMYNQPSFINDGAIDELKIIGDDGTEFDLLHNPENLATGGITQLEFSKESGHANLTAILKKRAGINFKLLNAPLPTEHEYKLSEIYAAMGFNTNMYAEYRRLDLITAPNFKIKIEKGQKLSEGVWESNIPGAAARMAIDVVGNNGIIKNNVEISRYQDLVEWGLFTDKYFNEAVPTGHPTQEETIKLMANVWDETGNVVEVDTGLTLQVSIID